MRLAVRQYERLVGWLESTADRGILFHYDAAYLRNPGARVLSQSLPLQEHSFPQAQALPFFAGLLPDGDLRRRVADWLHISESSTLRLLDALGGECAGTVSLQRMEDEGTTGDGLVGPGYEELESGTLEAMIRDAERLPLLAPRGGARLSLAGAQEKIPLLRRGGCWFRPLGGAVSSHILKPASPLFPDIVANEFACMRLAGALGLPVPPVEMEMIGRPVLIVERYDRTRGPDGSIIRIHQEDFCQALGILPDRKYQSDGGPGFEDIARLIRRVCTTPLADLELLIDIAVFNLLAGNCDAHGKNFSLLYREGKTDLAPFYDLVSTMLWPGLETELSMRFGREFRIEKLGSADLDAFAADIGVKPLLVRERTDALIKSASSEWDAVMALPELEGSKELVGRIREGWESRGRMLSARS